jgi:hypothetical protein
MRLATSSGLKIPLVFGAVPLTVGLSIFLFWLVTDWKWLQFIGLVTLCLGFGSVLAGFVYLGIWVLKMVRSGSWSRDRLMGQMLVVAVVLAANFPVACGILWTVYNLETRYTVVIRNHAPAALELAAITGGGVSLEIGRIRPGASITKEFRIVHDGTLVFSGEQSGRKLQVVVDSYVTNGSGGHKQIDVSPGGITEVQSSAR